MTLKIDFVNSAYSMGRISGLTRSPTPEDLSLGLERLEDMAAEWHEANISTGYTFEQTPGQNTPHNVQRKYHLAFKSNLMMLLLADFGKIATAELAGMASSSFSRLLASTSVTEQIQPPSTMPIGSGNKRLGRLSSYYTPIITAPNESATVKMVVGDVDTTFYEDYTAFLLESEDVSSAVITADSGLTISAETVTSPRVTYTVTATGGTDDYKALYEAKIIMTTSAGRILTRVRNFELTELDIT